MNQFATLMRDVLIETSKAGLEILNEMVNPLTYFDDEPATSCRDDRSIQSPLVLYIGMEYEPENIKVRLRPELIEVEAEEIPLDVLGAKVRQFFTVPYGVDLVSAVYDKREGTISIYLTLPDEDGDVVQEITPTPAL